MFPSTKRLLVAIALTLCTMTAAAAEQAAAECPEIGFAIVEPQATADTRLIGIGGGRTLFVRRQLLTKTADITGIHLAIGGGNTDDATLQIRFTPAADQRLHEATTDHSGMRIAFLFGNEVLINIVWQGPYGMDLGGRQISMIHGKNTAQRLMKAVTGCNATAH
jgi:hypothetical protein